MSEADSTTPSPRLGRNGSSEGSSRAAIGLRAPAGVALGVEQVVVERRGGEDLPLLGGHGLEDARVDVAQRLGDALSLRAGDQRRELEQLEVADDRVRDVEVGVEAQLAEPAAGPRRPLEQLVAQQPVGRVERLGRAEQLLLALLPLALERRARLEDEAATARAPAPRSLVARVGQHDPRARPGDRDVEQLRAARASRSAPVSGGSILAQQRIGDPLRRGHRRARRAGPTHVDVLGLERRRRRSSASTWTAGAGAAPAPPARAAPKSATAAIERANSRGVACGARRTYAEASSPKRASARSRSTTSAWAANSCWRRSPSRSIRRWT